VEALEALNQTRFEIILLDLQMPVMDGQTFLREFWKRPEPRPAFVVMTAYEDGAKIANQLGAAAFLHKSFSMNDLLAVIERLCLSGPAVGADPTAGG
jgi:CheY-like chemotaxis protein